MTHIADLEKTLDRLWTAKKKAEQKSRILYDKYYEIPELCLETSDNGVITLTKDKRHSLLERFRVFRMNVRYMSIIEAVHSLGFAVRRDADRHTIVSR